MTRAVGIDISKYDLTYSPKVNTDFVIQRLSYGLMKDERLEALQPAVLSVPVRGAYHYASSNVPWKAQVDLFLSLAAGKYDFLALDFEKDYNVDSSSFIGGVASALSTIQLASRKPVVLYVNPDTWNTWLLPVHSDLLQFDIWLAQYFTNRRDTDPLVPVTMTRGWKFWQWNDVGDGATYGTGGKHVDLDDFNGTVDDLHLWAHATVYKVCPMCNGTGKIPA